MKLPMGFRAAGGRCGIKQSGRPDLMVLAGDAPLAWAFTGTENSVKAACVYRNRALFEGGGAVRAIVVNSGNANCATGERGVWDNETMAEAAARALGVDKSEVLTGSTGIVGHPLPVERIVAALPDVVATASGDLEAASEAILTTDTVTKTAEATLPGGARVVGMAKGSGMIHPNMATMLAFVATDARIAPERLRALWKGVVDRSFNQVTVDGDTSPNDMAFVLASNRVDADETELERALEEVCSHLAQAIARDGEGATKLLTVRVEGARTPEEARAAARAVVRSPLVKAAAHGNDPNWGRIFIAVGSTGATMDTANVRIAVQGTAVFHGTPTGFDAADLSARMHADDLLIEVDLAAGRATGSAWGCDLSAEYVSINADYHT